MSASESPEDSPAAASAAPTRVWINAVTIVLGATIAVISLGFAADLAVVRRLQITKEQMLPVVLAAAFTIVFLRVPAHSRGRPDDPPFYDIVLAAVAFAACMVFAFLYNDIVEEYFYHRPVAFAIGIVIIPMVIETLRRTTGYSLVVVLLLFFVYGLFGHLVPGDLQGREKTAFALIAYLTADHVALFGLPLVIVCYVVLLFLFMGRLLVDTGASEWFTDLSMALLGGTRGGSAKIAVFASGLFGSISGSAVSNVASTGVITIPLMKQGGYDAQTAGAIEAVASTGGQIMPPIMGAAAFLMAEFLNVDYTEIIVAAFIPALLYFFSVFVQADLEAARLGVTRIPAHLIPPLFRVLREGWFFSVPFVILVVALFSFNIPPETAALYAALSLPVVSLAFGYKGRRITARAFVTAIFETGRTSADLIVLGAMAGLVIGIIETTGLGHALTIVLVEVGQGNLMLLLVLTAAICIVLGMGMPTTAIYLLLALMVAPPLVKLGVEPMAAHMFVLYYGLMSFITPPLAVAAFTGAKLAGAPPMATALTACRIGWVAYVIPFAFVFSPNLIMRGEPVAIALTFLSAALGIWVASCGLLGYCMRRLTPARRFFFCVAGVMLLLPSDGLFAWGTEIRLIGAALAAVLIIQDVRGGRCRRNPSLPETQSDGQPMAERTKQ